MLNPEDRRAIEGLFARLEEVESRTPDRDAEAEQLIRDEIARQPGAPYYLAQTVLVQEHALQVAEQRIQELEAQASRGRRGGLFGGLFDDGREARREVPQQRSNARGPWERNDGYNNQRGQGGGFLAGAAQTALGVTGGLLLGSAIGSLLGAGAAQADEGQQDNADQQDSGADQSDNDFGGGDDGGGFDMGGDF
jgi:hypothetical protein